MCCVVQCVFCDVFVSQITMTTGWLLLLVVAAFHSADSIPGYGRSHKDDQQQLMLTLDPITILNVI